MNEVFNFGNALALVLNVIEAITLVVTVSTFLYLMLNKFLKALHFIFAKTGLPIFTRLRILFICRKSFIKKRIFIEFAILKTQGHFKTRKEWRRIINEFKDYYLISNGEYYFDIDNITYLITEEFSEITERYFSFLNKVDIKKVYSSDEKNSWLIKIRVKDAYATPTCLISGLLSEYKENWDEFIKRYVSVAFMQSDDCNSAVNKVLTEELYFTFAWLLWGPSFEIEYKKYWGGLCQLSFGDESNSMPAIVTRNKGINDKLRTIFIVNSNKQYGELISPVICLHEKSYYSNFEALMNPRNAYFYKKAKGNALSFVASIDDFELATGFKARKYYCTAYVWILFELESDDSRLHPENLVAFFEHSNLSDANTYNFLIETLLNKVFLHFSKIFSDPNLKDRTYRFACSFNDTIKERFIEKYNEFIKTEEGKSFKGRLIETPKRTASEVFSEIDEFFYTESNIVFEEISKENKDWIKLLSEFYTSVYMESFPEDERETFDNLLHYLSQADENDQYKYHISVAKNEKGEIIGGAIYDYFSSINSGAIEFIVVKKDQQSIGLGSKIYEHIIKILSRDAHEFKNSTLKNIYCEIDSPETSLQSVKKYLFFWNKNNYKKIDFKYVQPSLSQDKKPVEGLWLVVAPIDSTETEISKDELIEFLRCYLKYCMQIEKPEENEIFIKMKKEIEELPSIEKKNII